MNKFEKVSLNEFKKGCYKFFPNMTDEEIENSYNDIQLPVRSTKHSAGYDFRIPFNIDVKAEQSIVIPTGIKIYMNENNFFLGLPRSSLGFKYGFRIANTAVIGDSDYVDNNDNEGHYFVKFSVEKDISLKQGDKFIQGIFLKYDITEDDNSTEDRKGGIGSTGV